MRILIIPIYCCLIVSCSKPESADTSLPPDIPTPTTPTTPTPTVGKKRKIVTTIASRDFPNLKLEYDSNRIIKKIISDHHDFELMYKNGLINYLIYNDYGGSVTYHTSAILLYNPDSTIRRIIYKKISDLPISNAYYRDTTNKSLSNLSPNYQGGYEVMYRDSLIYSPTKQLKEIWSLLGINDRVEYAVKLYYPDMQSLLPNKIEEFQFQPLTSPSSWKYFEINLTYTDIENPISKDLWFTAIGHKASLQGRYTGLRVTAIPGAVLPGYTYQLFPAFSKFVKEYTAKSYLVDQSEPPAIYQDKVLNYKYNSDSTRLDGDLILPGSTWHTFSYYLSN